MAKASLNITCKDCGQDFWHTRVCGNRAQANQYETWAEYHVTQCPECYGKAVRAAKEKARARQAMELAEKAVCPIDLPELIGSEKQVVWASTLRDSVIAQLNGRGIKWKAVKQAADDGDTEIADFLFDLGNPSAKWWIDNKGKEMLGGAAHIYVREPRR